MSTELHRAVAMYMSLRERQQKNKGIARFYIHANTEHDKRKEQKRKQYPTKHLKTTLRPDRVIGTRNPNDGVMVRRNERERMMGTKDTRLGTSTGTGTGKGKARQGAPWPLNCSIGSLPKATSTPAS